MLEISKILLPVDFSERACRAARYVVPFAGRFQAEVVLLHVLPPHFEFGSVELGTAVLEDLIVERRERAQRAIDTFLATEFTGLRTQRVLLDGDPAREIIDFAHEQHCDLIFMPTHGHGPFRRLLLGSVTAKVLHDADCPVWTGVHMEPPPQHGPGVLERVVCAVDLGNNSEKVLGWAARIATEFHASLTIVHAVSSLEPLTEGYQLSPEWRKYVLDQAQTDIAKLQRTVGTDAAVSVLMGEVTEVICAEASRLHADLLVIGRASRAGILGRLTEHAYAIIRASPCPAVSV
jgi:nucleotide-binding universal stress UspA family protein